MSVTPAAPARPAAPAAPRIDLSGRYEATSGRVLLTGVQALVRVIFDQVRADRQAGRRTAAFVSGYPGSPLGTFDLTLQGTGEALSRYDVTFLPGVNEDIAATAVWGSQQDHIAPLARHDGVIGFWYGKGPGVDRSGDALRHANLHGVGAGGGVLAAAGDDPAAKSSTLPHGSEVALYDAGLPILTPGTPAEVVTLGRHGYELSRFCGCWVGVKVVTAVADGFGAAPADAAALRPRLPDLAFDGAPWTHRQRPKLFLPDSLELEAELYDRRQPAALAYAQANGLNAVEVDPPDAWLAILAPGRTYREVRQALADLGLASDAQVAAAGIRLVRLGLIYPLDPLLVRRAARGVAEVLVVEEKRAFVEHFARAALYGTTGAPRLVGKDDGAGARLVPADGELTAERLLPLLRARLTGRLGDRLAPAPPRPRAPLGPLPVVTARRPAFCSGCPHNRSTVHAVDSPVGAGVGCHAMVLWSDRGAVSYSQMGGEGAQWLGRAPFTGTAHWMQNVGDGTFFHSASLVVRAAVAARARMTFKLLYNGTVAMTGGQRPAGQAAVGRVVAALLAEGVTRAIVLSEDPRRYRRRGSLPAGVAVWGRDRLADAERALAAVDGVTLLVYDSECATERRRRRKRGTAPAATRRVVVNEAVCEGCGDCARASSCLSVHPVDTPLGRKTQIDQASCNADFSCLDGDCPSFVTVAAPPARAAAPVVVPDVADLPEPARPVVPPGGAYRIVTVGIGGTGVVTVNQVLATAAFAEGLAVRGLDQTGLSQKGGPVVSHLVLTADEDSPASNAAGPGAADVYLALDPVAATDPRHLGKASAAHTATVAARSVVPTLGMVLGEDAPGDGAAELGLLARHARPGALTTVDAAGLAQAHLGEATTANVVALGAAYQAGLLPVSAAAVEAAIEANGVAVAANLAAFRLGRRAAHDPAGLPSRPRPGALAGRLGGTDRLDALAAELVGYQGVALARRFRALVAAAAAAQERVAPASTGFADAVAESFFHLLAYKDEYEVARLHLLPEFRAAVHAAVPGAERPRYLLHPPVLRSFGLDRKVALPAAVAEPAFTVLRGMRRLRGTPLDPFGHTAVRRTERALIEEYEADIRALLPRLPAVDLAAATAFARLPLDIRGYEHIKLDAVRRYRRDRAAALAALG